MDNKLYIPKELNVGFQERADTYSGKLAYIIYRDDKGKLRKENSWLGWKNSDIPVEILDNEPTEGFVLNKDVGGVSGYSSWHDNDRIEKVRVYDPRGFEFEITIPNLLFILQECTSVKGKGLDGKFVYAWDGPNLLLLPENSLEYRESMKFTSLQGKKVSKKDMVEGYVYTDKDMETLIYLGRFNYFDLASDNYPWRKGTDEDYVISCDKKHIFYCEKDKEFVPYPGFTHLSMVKSEESVDNYAELVDSYLKSFNGVKINELIAISHEPVVEKRYRHYHEYKVKNSSSLYVKISDIEYKKINFEWSDYDKKFIITMPYSITLNGGGFVRKSMEKLEKLLDNEEVRNLDLSQFLVRLNDGKTYKFQTKNYN